MQRHGLIQQDCKKALSTMDSDPASLPVPSKVEYRHLPSLIENAKSYTTNPKYAEWQVIEDGCFVRFAPCVRQEEFANRLGVINGCLQRSDIAVAWAVGHHQRPAAS